MADGLVEGWTVAALIGDGAIRSTLMATADWPLAAWLRRSATAFIWFNAGHILAIGILLGSILLLDLRLLGLFRSRPLETLGPPLATMAMLGAAAAVVTGFLIFTVRPAAYLDNAAFLAKLALLTPGASGSWRIRPHTNWKIVGRRMKFHQRCL